MQEAEPPRVLETAGRMGGRPWRAARHLLRPGPAPPHLLGSRRGQRRGHCLVGSARQRAFPARRTPSAQACARRSALVYRGTATPLLHARGSRASTARFSPQRLPQRSPRGVGPCFPRRRRAVPTPPSSGARLDAGAGPAPVPEHHLARGCSAGSLQPDVRLHCSPEFSEPTRRKRWPPRPHLMLRLAPPISTLV